METMNFKDVTSYRQLYVLKCISSTNFLSVIETIVVVVALIL